MHAPVRRPRFLAMRLDKARHDATVGPQQVEVGRARRARPGGRAAIGGLLVAVAMVGAFALVTGADGRPSGQAVVVRASIPAGARLSAEQLRLEAVALPDRTAAQAFTSIAELEGAVALAPLEPGELVQRSAVLLAAAGGGGDAHDARPEFTITLDRDRALNGALRRGERVDVLATYGQGSDAYTTVVVRDAVVRATGEGGGGGLGGDAEATLTLALPSRQDVMRLAHASEVGAVVVVRTTRADAASAGPDTYRASPTGPANPANPR